jgi:hypothetical protein
MRYEERVLAFIDILGFSESIKETMDKDTEIECETDKIYNLLEDVDALEIKHIKNTDNDMYASRVVSHFSDSIAISYLMTEKSGVFYILTDILFFCHTILQKGFLLRGAITCGKLYHSENKIFGPAMLAAHDMEQKLAVYPRIVFEDKIIAIAEVYPAKRPSKKEQLKVIKKFIIKDFDGLNCLNYFDAINYVVGEKDGILVYFNSLREAIIELEKSADKNISIYSKYLWLKEKYNCVLTKYKKKYSKDKAKIESPELYEYLKSIKLLDTPQCLVTQMS